jgi:hypothetical protein
LRDAVEHGGFREAARLGEITEDFENIDVHAALPQG